MGSCVAFRVERREGSPNRRARGSLECEAQSDPAAEGRSSGEPIKRNPARPCQSAAKFEFVSPTTQTDARTNGVTSSPHHVSVHFQIRMLSQKERVSESSLRDRFESYVSLFSTTLED